MNGIDASAELARALNQLETTHAAARDAPRSRSLYTYLLSGMQSSEKSAAFSKMTNELILMLGIWWSPDAYSRLPVMTPWCVRDRSCRYDQGPESWGAPRPDGYFRDDNSIIKKLPLAATVAAAPSHPYSGRRLSKGFTACHIWGDLPSGARAGENPWLYSFIPNLVWLPSALAPLTDRQGSATQALLQRTSISAFRFHVVESGVQAHVETAWNQLPAPEMPGPHLPTDQLATFVPPADFVNRRLAYLDRIIDGCDSLMATGTLKRKLIASRYTAGLATLDPAAIGEFRTRMPDYRDAARST